MLQDLIEALADCRADALDVSQDGSVVGVVAWRGDHYCALSLDATVTWTPARLVRLRERVDESLDRHAISQGQEVA